MPEIQTNLPAIYENGRVPATDYVPVSHAPEPEPVHHAVPLSHYLWILKRQRWKILAFVAGCVLMTFLISKRLTPIYESTAIVDVDRQSPQGIVGQDSIRLPVNDADQYLATQVKLIQSSSVLRPVALKYNLLKDDPEARNHNEILHGASTPVRLKRLKVSRPPNTYLLQVSYRSPDPVLAANVANAVANSYIEHTYDIRIRSSIGLSSFMEKQLEELRAKMERSSAALAQFERELNVINPEEKTSILSARMLQLNTEYTNAQADRVRKEAAFQFVRNGSLEAAQVSTQGEALKNISDRLNEANEKFAEVKSKLGPSHQDYKKWSATVAELQQQLEKTRQNIGGRIEIEYGEALRREQMLQKELTQTKAESDRLNARSFEYKALQREAEADKKLYEELVQKIKEAGINAGFQGNAIRLADAALPSPIPVFPNLKLNLLLALLLSATFATGAALFGDMVDNTIRDPEQAKRLLNAEVVGILPVAGSRRSMLAMPRMNAATALIRTDESKNNRIGDYLQAVRTLRNSILLSNFDKRFSSLLVTSAAPREGKTMTAVHLALAHAEQRHRTLLIDGDLRRPSVHKYFDLGERKGLSNVILEGLPWRSAIGNMPEIPDLDVITAGFGSRKAADLVGKDIQQIISQATREYDLVVIDSPPMLGFAEPLQMATSVEGVVIVTHAGETNRRAVTSLLATLKRLRVNVSGIVLNRMDRELSEGYYYYGYGYYGT